MENYNGFRKITNRVPYSTIGIDYSNISTITKKGGNFEKILNKKIADFKRQGITTNTCLNYFEDMIDGYIEKLLSILEHEHLSCKNTIGYLFRKRASDKIEFKELLDSLEEAIASTEEEYKAIKEIYEKYNPLKNGRLAAEGSEKPSTGEGKDE